MRRRPFLGRLAAAIAAACGLPSAPREGPSAAPAQAEPAVAPTTTPAVRASPSPPPSPTAGASTAEPASSPGATPFSLDRGRLYDVHTHYFGEMLPTLRTLSARAVVFGGGPGLVALARANPDLVLPFLGIAPDSSGRRLLSEETLASIQRQLDSGPWRGLGEISFRHGLKALDMATPVDGPMSLRLFELAASRRVPVNVHVDGRFADELDRALDKSPDTTVIWAHAGVWIEPNIVRDLLRRHPRLYADISSRWEPFPSRFYIETPSGSLRPEWKSLLIEHSDRFLFGTDFTTPPPPGQPVVGTDPSNVARVVAHYGDLLGQLPAGAAERIAYTNAARLFSG